MDFGRASGPGSGIGGVFSAAGGVAPRTSVQVPTTITNVRQTLTLLFEHRPALMGHEQVVKVIRVLLFLREDPFEEHPVSGLRPRSVPSHASFRRGRYELPIRTPVPKTRNPPPPTRKTAETSGVSMYGWRTHEMAASSTSTTATAIAVAVRKSGMRK